MDDLIIPIRIREDLVVKVGFLPEDMTKEEADKICRIIMAFATEVE